MNIEFIRKEVGKARYIFDNKASEISADFFSDFPRGCCGNASDFLGTWLEAQGVSGLEYVNGVRDGMSHGWLEFNGEIIDITSDQFDDGYGSVFIDNTSAFHDSFRDQSRSAISVSPILSLSYKVFSKLMENT